MEGLSQARTLGAVAVLVFASFVQCSGLDLSGAKRTSSQESGPTGSDAAAPPRPTPPTDAAPNDGCEGRKVCDSFENDALGAAPGAPWSASPSDGGSVSVTAERAFRGTRSVKFTTTGAEYQRAMIDATSLFPLAGNVLYGRMMVWLENPAADGVHWTMLEGVGAVPGQPDVTAFMTYGGQLAGKMLAGYDTQGKSTDCWQHSETVMPTQRWVCVSFMLGGATGQKSQMRLSLDGTEVGDLAVDGAGQGCLGNDLGGQWLAPTFAKASFGWESYQQDVGHTIYIDDVALDDAPIPCP